MNSCHDSSVSASFTGRVLWVGLGAKRNALFIKFSERCQDVQFIHMIESEVLGRWSFYKLGSGVGFFMLAEIIILNGPF